MNSGRVDVLLFIISFKEFGFPLLWSIFVLILCVSLHGLYHLDTPVISCENKKLKKFDVTDEFRFYFRVIKFSLTRVDSLTLFSQHPVFSYLLSLMSVREVIGFFSVLSAPLPCFLSTLLDLVYRSTILIYVGLSYDTTYFTLVPLP